jgi:hypothetical protein
MHDEHSNDRLSALMQEMDGRSFMKNDKEH